MDKEFISETNGVASKHAPICTHSKIAYLSTQSITTLTKIVALPATLISPITKSFLFVFLEEKG